MYYYKRIDDDGNVTEVGMASEENSGDPIDETEYKKLCQYLKENAVHNILNNEETVKHDTE